MNPHHVILLGPPGSGKGTQAKFLVQNYELTHISTGNLLRAEMQGKTELGAKAKDFIDKGALVPDSLVIDMLVKFIKTLDPSKGWLLDGFPRTAAQALEITKQSILTPTSIIELLVNEDTICERMSGRRFDPITGDTYHIVNDPAPVAIAERCIVRSDDKIEIIKERFQIYRDQCAGIHEVFGDQVKKLSVDGSTISQVSAQIKDILG
ncbi:Adenylate kinase 1 [Spironucleus salmonicida]|uniref:Adenylate kinase 1 n=1 Tax=Spironucleus salmonicida TaxID=348837 RepID=K7R5G6_9EUKA|nr:adenylate kinase 1 [Spironucleus salmonicida]KAH0574197.1 Adenylate kinase 1 [Spironucleus salmonicida]|eukprot:EST49026.1 Adenylate kinase 1 [Spironucleus salmonicida]